MSGDATFIMSQPNDISIIFVVLNASVTVFCVSNILLHFGEICPV